MRVTLLYKPEDRELKLCLRAIWVTMGKMKEPKTRISSSLLHCILTARHSPIRVLNFCFLFEDIPSNTATHLARHVHAIPFVQSLRNDRQERMDGDQAPRNTPINMMYYVNAEELMTIANKRLCARASAKTREAVQMMCDCVLAEFPEFRGLLVPMCEYHGGTCHEILPCGRNKRRDGQGDGE